MHVIKRDGRRAQFNKENIKTAISKAFESVDGEITPYAKEKAREIANYIEAMNKKLSVEEIQDEIEKKLMASNRKDVAKAYILYRDERTRERERKSALIKVVGEKLRADNVQNQNANVDEHSFGGRKGEADSELMKTYALNYCMSEMSRNNHLNNEIYIHDLDSYAVGMSNCLSLPFDKLLANGFNTRQTDIRPANSVNTAFQLVAVLFQLQSLQQFGGVSATHLDWTMVPYVKKSFKKHLKDGFKYVARGDDYIDKLLQSDEEIGFEYPGLKDNYDKAYQYAYEMTEKETQQAVEGMYHNLRVLGRLNSNIKNIAA